jgi:1-acyl-sn-glycerol-3-phosphate acyltransferase
MAALAIKANYKKIKLSNTDRIPKGKPVILAANHPTAFIEPCILACFLDRPLYFLVRGDFFKKSFYESLLRNLHMLPVYRLRDGGYSNIKQNYATFESCFQALRERKTIMILAEGRTIHEKRLRPLRKGTARIALGALDRYPDIGEVYIVPVGVNYTYADQSRSEVLIDFGHPMLASDYLSSYAEQPNQAISNFTADLRERMLERIVVIEAAKDEELTERLLVMHRSEQPEKRFPVLENDPERLEMELQVAETVNRISEEDKQQLWSWLDLYFEKLDALRLEDPLISRRYQVRKGLGLKLTLGLPFYLIGTLWSYPPLALAKWIVDKNVRAIEFYEPVRLAVSIGAFLLWAIIWLVVGISAFGWWGIPLVAVLFLLGYFAVIYREDYRIFQLERRFLKVEQNTLKSLREDRQKILSFFQQLETIQPSNEK